LSLFDDTHPNATFDDVLIAGHTERTVVLYVELEHPSQAPERFSVNIVDVTIGGAGGVRMGLLPRDGKSPPELFLLRLSAHERYNLLLAVELLSFPISKQEALLLGVSASSLGEELQRPVTITLRWQPFSGSLSWKRRQGNGRRWNGRAFVPDAIASSAPELPARPHDIAVTGGGPDRQRSAVGTPFTVSYYPLPCVSYRLSQIT